MFLKIVFLLLCRNHKHILKINVLLIICVLAYLYQKINYCLLLTTVVTFVTIFIYYTNHEMQMKDSTYIQVLQKD